MIKVTRKDNKESVENLLRRFNRKVQQSGVLTLLKERQYFEKPISRNERRKKAISRKERALVKFPKARTAKPGIK
ncbi:MAG: 30S ribosomal protein S21 [bacterium]|jgi:ribosomal protein S21